MSLRSLSRRLFASPSVIALALVLWLLLEETTVAARGGNIQMTTTESSRRKSKRRQAAVYSDDDDDDEQNAVAPSEAERSSKRVKTEEESVDFASTGDVDVDGDDEEVKAEDEEDTRFLPPSAKRARRESTSAKVKGKQASRKQAGKKRAVVLSDEEGGGDYNEEDSAEEEDDDDFEPEPSATKRGTVARPKGKGIRKGSKDLKEEKEIAAKDERKSIPPAPSTSAIPRKRSHPPEDEEPVDVETVAKEPTPPQLKKRKLPTIKKNKPAVSTASSTPSSAKPATKGASDEKDAFALPAPVRKPAATIGNADFDLRDPSVYTQLFHKPGGSTPNAGLNRKEKEEERRRELNKMREEARAKRAEEAKHSFDLQAAAEKIQRFEKNLQTRKSMAVFPNILGAAFREAYDRARRRDRERSNTRTSH